MTQIDIIVPVRNEEENIPRFVDAIESLKLQRDVQVKVAFVEDGSTDGTVAVLRDLSKQNPRILYYSMRNRFGEGPAVMFGISRSDADAMIMMAVESHPPELIPPMIQAFLDGAEVVQCVRDSFAGRPRHRDIGTAAFVPFIRFLTGFDYQEQNVYFRLVSRNFARRLLESPRYWRFLRFPIPDEKSGKLRKIHATMSERRSGKSQYTVGRLLVLALDGILTCMSSLRMAAWTMALLLIAGGLFRLNQVLLALFLVGAASALVYRYLWLRNFKYVEKLVLKECSDDRFAEGHAARGAFTPKSTLAREDR